MCSQANPQTVEQERRAVHDFTALPYQLTFTPPEPQVQDTSSVSVAIVREEGSNGDREMVAALTLAGFEVSCVSGIKHDCPTVRAQL